MSKKRPIKLEPCEGGPVDPQKFNEVARIVGKIIIDSLPDEEEETEFEPCSYCDGHDACEDFGCAYEFGLGHMVKPML